MFVGHYSVAFSAKSERNKIPAWVLFVAVQLDFLGAPFALLGIEEGTAIAVLRNSRQDRQSD
jgi:hypothetical protein